MQLRLGVEPSPLRPEVAQIRARLARLVAAGLVRHRLDLAEASGLSRTAVHQHVQGLLDAGLLVEDPPERAPGRGRPAGRLRLRPDAARVVTVDVGTLRHRVGLYDLTGRRRGERVLDVALARGPEAVLGAVVDAVRALVAEPGEPSDATERPGVVVVGLPGPVDVAAGVPVRPPIMPGWDGFGVAAFLGAALGHEVLVDNDADLMALGEARSLAPEECPLVLVTVGTGIGAGIVDSRGALHHGADGAAGDLGHIPAPVATRAVCSCGNTGCVEAVAAVPAMLAAAAAVSAEFAGLDEAGFCERVAQGSGVALRAVREAAEVIGQVTATLISVYNPRRVVLGGPLATASDDLLAGVRSVVYRRALPLATRRLTLTTGVLGERAATTGALVLGLEHLLSPARIGDLLHPA
ncbi:ROK family protein [Kineococcus gynurae]|uniref:ROK family protein n=1 Tax=Kineococcus gynurae TaxID=452979 RepID=A0ABV5LWI0_9ACTN